MVQEEYIKDALNNQNYEPITDYINRIRYDYMRNAKLYSLASTIGDMCSALFEIICENGFRIFANQFTEGISFGEANINGKTLKKAKPFSQHF